MTEELAKYEAEQESTKNKKEPEKISIQDQIVSLIPLAGTIELTADQEKILYSPVVIEDIEIRPDGLIYLPWMEYVTRLRSAFGMSWSLIPYGPPKKIGNFIHWAFWLIIKGKPYGFAVGEQQYFENDRMTYGDALEGAKSNALMRLCKGLGISLELWKPSFIKEWKGKFSETYVDEKGKTKWKKRGCSISEDNQEKETKYSQPHKHRKEESSPGTVSPSHEPTHNLPKNPPNGGPSPSQNHATVDREVKRQDQEKRKIKPKKQMVICPPGGKYGGKEVALIFCQTTCTKRDCESVTRDPGMEG